MADPQEAVFITQRMLARRKAWRRWLGVGSALAATGSVLVCLLLGWRDGLILASVLPLLLGLRLWLDGRAARRWVTTMLRISDHQDVPLSAVAGSVGGHNYHGESVDTLQMLIPEPAVARHMAGRLHAGSRRALAVALLIATAMWLAARFL